MVLTFRKRFDKIYLAAENGGKLFRKTSGLTAERVLKKMKKVVDKNESLWEDIKVAADTDRQQMHFENRRLNSM